MWLVVAAILLAPAGRARRTPSRPSRRALQLGAGAAAAGIAVAVLPLIAGAIAGLCAAPLAAHWAGRLHDRPDRGAQPDAALALVLAASALRSGVPVTVALELASPAASDDVGELLARVAGLLRLGATPEQAWSALPVDGAWAPVAVLARRSGHSGIKLADAFEHAAAQLIAAQRAAALARAQRVGVLAVGPLGACFLPAFVCLGIVPVVIAVASGFGDQLR